MPFFCKRKSTFTTLMFKKFGITSGGPWGSWFSLLFFTWIWIVYICVKVHRNKLLSRLKMVRRDTPQIHKINLYIIIYYRKSILGVNCVSLGDNHVTTWFSWGSPETPEVHPSIGIILRALQALSSTSSSDQSDDHQMGLLRIPPLDSWQCLGDRTWCWVSNSGLIQV